MLKSTALANAATLVTVIFYTACALLSYLVPGTLMTIAQSWVHTLNLEPLRSGNTPQLGLFGLGLVSLSGLTWITVYAFAEVYNQLAKKTK